LAAIKPAESAATPSPGPSAQPGGAPPQIVLHPHAPRPSAPSPVVTSDGWQTVLRRHTSSALCHLDRRPHRPVPVDLRGKCVHYFSPDHRARGLQDQHSLLPVQGEGPQFLFLPASSLPSSRGT
jgi:hypothetical protein